MMLNNGSYDKIRIYTIKAHYHYLQQVGDSWVATERYLGWESPSGKSSGGVYLSNNSFGHTGFTGTSLWIDPENDIFVILLTNAVHPFLEQPNTKIL